MNTRGCRLIYYIGANYAEGLITHPFIGEGVFYVLLCTNKQVPLQGQLENVPVHVTVAYRSIWILLPYLVSVDMFHV